jgi:hypothetical protein
MLVTKSHEDYWRCWGINLCWAGSWGRRYSRVAINRVNVSASTVCFPMPSKSSNHFKDHYPTKSNLDPPNPSHACVGHASGHTLVGLILREKWAHLSSMQGTKHVQPAEDPSSSAWVFPHQKMGKECPHLHMTNGQTVGRKNIVRKVVGWGSESWKTRRWQVPSRVVHFSELVWYQPTGVDDKMLPASSSFTVAIGSQTSWSVVGIMEGTLGFWAIVWQCLTYVYIH